MKSVSSPSHHNQVFGISHFPLVVFIFIPSVVISFLIGTYYERSIWHSLHSAAPIDNTLPDAPQIEPPQTIDELSDLAAQEVDTTENILDQWEFVRNDGDTVSVQLANSAEAILIKLSVNGSNFEQIFSYTPLSTINHTFSLLSIAISTNKDQISFTDIEGLHIYDFNTATTTLVRRHKTTDSTNNYYAVVEKWFGNDEYVLYTMYPISPTTEPSSEMHYGMYNIKHDTTHDKIISGSVDSVDIQTIAGNTYLIYASTGESNAVSPGLFIADISNAHIEPTFSFENLLQNVTNAETVNVTSVLFDDIDERLVFTFHKDANWLIPFVGSINVDGTAYTEIRLPINL